MKKVIITLCLIGTLGSCTNTTPKETNNTVDSTFVDTTDVKCCVDTLTTDTVKLSLKDTVK